MSSAGLAQEVVMSAGLRKPIAAPPHPSLQPQVGRQAGQRRAHVVSILGGCGLVAGGLLSGSWPGGAVAAVGGLLVYHGLTRGGHFRRATHVPALPPPAVEEEVAEQPAPPAGLATEGPVGPAAEPEPSAPSPVDNQAAPVASAYGTLPPEEHIRALARAYFLALERGGGILPPYDRAGADTDYWRALAEVRAAQQGVTT
jgi:hypothetical protein